MSSPFLPARWVITPSLSDTLDDPLVFPFMLGQGFKIEKTPVWSTHVDTAVSGTERRRPLWSYPIWKFKLGYEFIRDDSAALEFQRITTFFNNKNGSNSGWFYLDRDDHTVTNMPFGTGDGTTTAFQVMRTVTVGSLGLTFQEPVRAFDGSPQFYVNGVLTSATINALGRITFASAPAAAAALTWTGSFLFLCRFEKDELTGLRQIAHGFWDLSTLSFQTFKP